jgi:iron complex transport system permease protein
VIGALLLSGGVIGALDSGFAGLAFTAILLLVLAVVIRSGFLRALVPLAVAGALGSNTGYFHATYMLMVTEPTITIVFFALLALAAYLVSNRVGPAYEGRGIIAAHMSLVLVNFGFWVGSLWGDHPGESWAVAGREPWTAREAWEKAALHVPDWVFTVAWAVLVIGVGIWAARANRRWVVTTAATFCAINFYTQWFALSARAQLAPVGWRIREAPDLGAEPWVIIVAGLTIIRIAVGLWRYHTPRAGGVPPTRGRCIAGTRRCRRASSVNWTFPRPAWAARR